MQPLNDNMSATEACGGQFKSQSHQRATQQESSPPAEYVSDNLFVPFDDKPPVTQIVKVVVYSGRKWTDLTYCEKGIVVGKMVLVAVTVAFNALIVFKAMPLLLAVVYTLFVATFSLGGGANNMHQFTQHNLQDCKDFLLLQTIFVVASFTLFVAPYL